MIDLYVVNIFVERPIWRIMFGPKYSSINWQQNLEERKENKDKDFKEMAYDTPEHSQHLFSMKNFTIKDNLSSDMALIDETVRKILKIYDEIEPHLKRLGVDIDPHKLIQDKYKYSVSNGRLGLVEKSEQKKILNKMEFENYSPNSIWSLFVNNSVNAYDLYTGIDSFKNGEIIRWNYNTHMDAWFGRSCNNINGTDGNQFAPFLQKTRIYRFLPRICR